MLIYFTFSIVTVCLLIVIFSSVLEFGNKLFLLNGAIIIGFICIL